MRAGLLSLLLLAAAGTAAAQDLQLERRLDVQQRLDLQMRLNELQAQQDMARQREIARQNEIMALEARLRAEQGLADVRAQSLTPRLPPIPSQGAGPPPDIDTSQLTSIPDAALADSDRRVREAARNRR